MSAHTINAKDFCLAVRLTREKRYKFGVYFYWDSVLGRAVWPYQLFEAEFATLHAAVDAANAAFPELEPLTTQSTEQNLPLQPSLCKQGSLF